MNDHNSIEVNFKNMQRTICSNQMEHESLDGKAQTGRVPWAQVEQILKK